LSLIYRINKLVVPPSISDKMMILSVDVWRSRKFKRSKKLNQIKSYRNVSDGVNKRIVFNFSFTNGTARRSSRFSEH
jgi:hypothetical protein